MSSLNGELVVDVADGEPLSVDGDERDPPLLLGNAGQLRDVSGRLNMNMVSSQKCMIDWEPAVKTRITRGD